MTNTADLPTRTAEMIAEGFMAGDFTSLLIDLEGHPAVDPDGDMAAFQFEYVRVTSAYFDDASTLSSPMVWLETSEGDFYFDGEDSIPVVP